MSSNCGRSIFLDYVSATARIYGSANDISHHNYHIFNLLRLIYKNISSHPKDSISYINGNFSTLERAKEREYDIWCSFTLVRYHWQLEDLLVVWIRGQWAVNIKQGQYFHTSYKQIFSHLSQRNTFAPLPINIFTPLTNQYFHTSPKWIFSHPHK